MKPTGARHQGPVLSLLLAGPGRVCADAPADHRARSSSPGRRSTPSCTGATRATGWRRLPGPSAAPARRFDWPSGRKRPACARGGAPMRPRRGAPGCCGPDRGRRPAVAGRRGRGSPDRRRRVDSIRGTLGLPGPGAARPRLAAAGRPAMAAGVSLPAQPHQLRARQPGQRVPLARPRRRRGRRWWRARGSAGPGCASAG